MDDRASARTRRVLVPYLAATLVLGVVLVAGLRMTTGVAALTTATSLTAGSAPVGIAVDPASGRIYVTNSGSDTLSVIDPATNATLATVPTGAGPNQVVAQGLTKAWVADQLSRYTNWIEEGGRLAMNPQLGPRLQLMQKILDLWPED